MEGQESKETEGAVVYALALDEKDRAGVEKLGFHRLLADTCAAGSVCNLSFAPGVHKHDIPPVFAAATGESIVCPGLQSERKRGHKDASPATRRSPSGLSQDKRWTRDQ
eukprot:4591113-Amphidinium_carterae.1